MYINAKDICIEQYFPILKQQEYSFVENKLQVVLALKRKSGFDIIWSLSQKQVPHTLKPAGQTHLTSHNLSTDFFGQQFIFYSKAQCVLY